jgi:2'-deoxynucleoside 5'-phosphate N-hydrolase
MKIYFAGSIRGGRDDKALYASMIEYLSQFGLVLTEHVADANLTESGEDGQSDEWIYARDMSWLRESDVVIADVSTPSIGVGYEVAQAEVLNKKILCVYRNQMNKQLSAMISGNTNLEVSRYETLDDVLDSIGTFMKALI